VTVSQILTSMLAMRCGVIDLSVEREGNGLAIRVPRFTGNYRLGKSAEDAPTVDELVEMYKGQLKKIQT
jgi:ATP-dependent DNA ligase